MIFSSLRQHLTWTHFLPKFRLNPSYTKLLTKMVDWLIFKIVLVNGFSSWEGVVRPRRTVKVPSTSHFAGRCKFLCLKKNFLFFEFLSKSHKSSQKSISLRILLFSLKIVFNTKCNFLYTNSTDIPMFLILFVFLFHIIWNLFITETSS